MRVFLVRVIVFFLFLCSATALVSGALAQTCSGSGCENITLEKVDGCMRFRNTGKYPIQISVGAGLGAPTIYPGTPEILYSGIGICMQNLIRNYKATQVGGPPPAAPKSHDRPAAPKPEVAQQPSKPAPVAPPPANSTAGLETDGRDYYTFKVQNKCEYAVRLALRLRDTDEKWQTNWWYYIGGSDTARLTHRGNSTLKSYNKTAYYFAEVMGYFRWVPSGQFRTYSIGGRDLDFAEVKAGTNSFQISLSCPSRQGLDAGTWWGEPDEKGNRTALQPIYDTIILCAPGGKGLGTPICE